MSNSQLRFFVLSLFIVVVAVVTFLLHQRWQVVAIVMGLAWAIAAAVDFTASRRGRRSAAAGVIVLRPRVERAPEPTRARRGGRARPTRDPLEPAPTPGHGYRATPA